MRQSLPALLIGLVALATAAAPAAKTKSEPLPPPTTEQFQKAENNLKEIALGWHNYHDTYGHFPSNEVSKDGKPLLSWRVQLLPYLEAEDLHKQFKLDEPWDSEANKKLIDKMPRLYAPVRGKADPGLTYYQVFTGKAGLIKSGQKLALFGITDGTSNTLLCVEAGKPVVWTKPDDLEFDGKQLPALGGMFDGRFHGAMCDGSVRRFKKSPDADVMRRLIGPQDGEVVSVDDAVDPDGDKN
jgi:hypothetical protein